MKSKLLSAILLCILLSGCSPTINNTPDPAKPSLANTLNKVEPTQTPTRIPTQTPTATPAPVTLEDYIPSEGFFSYNGSGDDVVADLKTETFSSLKFTCSDEGYKAIKAHHDDTYDLLVNSTGPYSGYTFLLPDTDYTLEINASSDWTVEAFELGISSTDSFTGSGDWISPVFISSSDIYEINTDGDGYFAVKGYYGNGSYDLLVNTTDPYSGKIMFNQKGEYCFFEIISEREWSIQP